MTEFLGSFVEFSHNLAYFFLSSLSQISLVRKNLQLLSFKLAFNLICEKSGIKQSLLRIGE